MLRRCVALLVSLILLPSPVPAAQKTAEQRARELQAKAAKLKQGQGVEVLLIDGTKIQGKLSAVTAQGLEIQPKHGAAGSIEKAGFKDIRSLDKWSPTWGKHKALKITLLVVAGLIVFHSALFAALGVSE